MALICHTDRRANRDLDQGSNSLSFEEILLAEAVIPQGQYLKESFQQLNEAHVCHISTVLAPT